MRFSIRLRDVMRAQKGEAPTHFLHFCRAEWLVKLGRVRTSSHTAEQLIIFSFSSPPSPRQRGTPQSYDLLTRHPPRAGCTIIRSGSETAWPEALPNAG